MGKGGKSKRRGHGATPRNRDFDEARDCFPIRSRGKANQAVTNLLAAQQAADPIGSRAKAWLGYLYAIAVMDRWDWTERQWAETKLLDNEQAVLDLALQKCNAALVVLQSTPYAYDAHWALFMVHLAKRAWPSARTAVQDAKTANWYIPEMLAEAGDIEVYLGDLAAARVDIDRAITLKEVSEQGEVPPWFYWIEAWIYFAEAAVEPDPTLQRVRYLAAAGAALQMLQDDKKLEDFDAAILLAVIFTKTGKHAMAARWWHQAMKSIDREKHHLDEDAVTRYRWTAALEEARTPFDTSNPQSVTSKIHAAWMDAVTSLARLKE